MTIGHDAPRDESDTAALEALSEIIEHAAPEHRAHFEDLRAVIEAGPETITVPLSSEQFAAAVYALRWEAHRQDPAAYPHHRLAYPDYDSWPSVMSATADYLEQRLISAGVSIPGASEPASGAGPQDGP
jgi:hypothetical protein